MMLVSILHVLKFILLLTCSAGFVWLTFKEFKKFLKGATFVSSTFELEDSHFPDIVFCPNHGFADDFTNATFPVEATSWKEYQSITQSAQVEFLGLFVKIDVIKSVNFEYFDVSTSYNGICRVFQFNQAISWVCALAINNHTSRIFYCAVFINKRDMVLVFSCK